MIQLSWVLIELLLLIGIAGVFVRGLRWYIHRKDNQNGTRY